MAWCSRVTTERGSVRMAAPSVIRDQIADSIQIPENLAPTIVTGVGERVYEISMGLHLLPYADRFAVTSDCGILLSTRDPHFDQLAWLRLGFCRSWSLYRHDGTTPGRHTSGVT